MITNSNVTLYVNWYNQESKKMEYVNIKLNDVWYKLNNKMDVNKDGLTNSSEYKVRIPIESFRGLTYIESKKYVKLPLDQRDSYLTIHDGAIMIPYLVDDKITSISDLKKKYDNVARVVNYSINMIGSSKHISIGGSE